MFQGKSVCILGLLEPKLPARKGSVLCLRSATFLRRMRVEGEGHLTAAGLEKESIQAADLGQLCCGRERKQQVVFALLPGGHLRQWWWSWWW